MPAINPRFYNRTSEYKEMMVAASKNNETNDCAVRAVSVATDTPYETVLDLLARMGRLSRKGTRTSIIERAVKLLGYRMEFVPDNHFIRQYPKAHQILKSVTTHHADRFNKVWADGNTYLMYTTGHILCIKDGVNHDWTRGRACRSQGIYRIVKDKVDQY